MVHLIIKLTILHTSIIVISNLLVQYPFTILGLHTTWGAFSYPLIFISTDLTVRLLGANTAKKVIFTAMLPAIVFSYLVSAMFQNGHFLGLAGLLELDLVAFRVSLACFIAYVVGQLLDIKVFTRFRNSPKWWLAPSLSGLIGNFIDTLVFFFVAFYHSSNAILSEHWQEIAMVDFCFKYFITIVCFVPLYGLVLEIIQDQKKIGVF